MDLYCYLCFVCVMLCSLVVSCLERAGLLALMYVICIFVFYCIFVTLSYGVLSQVWHLIVSIPDPCPLIYLQF